jgi:hypothetical protein
LKFDCRQRPSPPSDWPKREGAEVKVALQLRIHRSARLDDVPAEPEGRPGPSDHEPDFCYLLIFSDFESFLNYLSELLKTGSSACFVMRKISSVV